MTAELAALYPAHLARVMANATAALAVAGFDHLLIASGTWRNRFLDDHPYPFCANPHFKHWLPLTDHSDCWIAFTPGQRPLLIYFQPDDYWHQSAAAPSGYWLEHFEVRVIQTPEQAGAHLPASGRAAIIGEAEWGLAGWLPNNPPVVLNHLHYQRASKTEYELANLRRASRRAVAGHRVAATLFHEGAAEMDIHRAYLIAVGHTENELPYGNIVALNEHAAILHYQHQRLNKPPVHHSFLIDAGAQVNGYAADITRTYSAVDDEFQSLIDALDSAQLALCDQVRIGRPYPDIHLDAHARIAHILKDQDLVRMDPQSMLATGVTSAFFPHGVGHLLGLQVHDIGGFMATADGDVQPCPEGHRFLRLTRTLEENFVVTIEPGIYFIDRLLAEIKAGRHAGSVHWDKVDRLRRFGGIRIEDDVRVTTGQPENLTRDAFAAH